jgi:hypothetical protein
MIQVQIYVLIYPYVLPSTCLVLNPSSCQRLTSNRVDNCGQVFGTQKLYWVLPMYTQEDQKKMTVLHGLDYPLRPDLES